MPKADDGENQLPPVSEMVASSLYDVAGKRVVITGGGSGIGAMIAAGFVANGAVVYIVSRKDTTPYADSLTAWGRGTCFSLQADISSHDDVARIVAVRFPGQTGQHQLGVILEHHRPPCLNLLPPACASLRMYMAYPFIGAYASL